MFLLKLAKVEIAADLPVLVDVEFAGEGERPGLVLRRLRIGVDAREALAQEIDRRWADDAKIAGRPAGDDMHLRVRRAVAKVAIGAHQRRRRGIAPAAVMRRVGGDVDAVIIDLLAILEIAGDAAIGAAENLRLRALPVEAVLHLDADRAAERVEAEDRVGGKDVRACDRLRRDQIPVDRVAKRLVDAHAVLIDGEPLRRALLRRGVEAAILQFLRKRIAGDVVDEHAGDALLQRVGDVGRTRALDLLRRHRLHHAWKAVDVLTAGPRQRRRGDHVHLGKRDHV